MPAWVPRVMGKSETKPKHDLLIVVRPLQQVQASLLGSLE